MDFFGRNGRPVAYLANGYLLRWNGQRAAIVQHNAIYSLNGKHIGYIHDGWVRDKRGHAVSFSPGASGGPMPPIPMIAPIKAIPPIHPIAPIMGIPPIMPIASLSWSQLDFERLLTT